VAKPRRDQHSAAIPASRAGIIGGRLPPLPRAANDNATTALRRLYRLFPLGIAFLALFWALWRSFFA